MVFYGEDSRVRGVIEAVAAQRKAPFEVITSDNVSSIEKKGKFIDFCLNNRYYKNAKLFSIECSTLSGVEFIACGDGTCMAF